MRSLLTIYLFFLVSLCLSISPLQAQEVVLSGGNTTVVLQTTNPGDSIFRLPSSNKIAPEGSGIEGDDSQNWQFTNEGVIDAGTSISGSGIRFGSRDAGMATITNKDSIVSRWQHGNGPSGIQFTNGGQVYNHAGGWIEGYDGIHTDKASVLIENAGTIYGSFGGGTSIYSGEGLKLTNFASGVIDGKNYAISSNGFDRNAEILNYGTIRSNNSAVYLYHGVVYALYNAPGATITGGGGKTISLDGSTGYMLNEGSIHATHSALYSKNEGGNNVYVNADSIVANNGYAIETDVSDRGSTIYNLGVLSGTQGSVSLKGDSLLFVLGQTTYLKQIDRIVTGTGSKLEGDAISEAPHNKVKLTDTGSEDNALKGFQSLTMEGTAWALTHPLTLTDSLIIKKGNLTFSDSIRLNTPGGAILVENGGILTLADSVKITLPEAAVFRVDTGGLLNIFHTYGATGGNYLTIPDSTVISGTIQFDSLLVINSTLILSGATLNIHPGADTIRVNGTVDISAGNNRINLPDYTIGTYYTLLTATEGITGDATAFGQVMLNGSPLPTCNYELIVANDTIKLLIKDGSVAIQEQPSGGIVWLGGDYTFSVEATGENLYYYWYKDDEKIAEGTDNTLTIQNALLQDEGMYYATVTNGCATVNSTTAYLWVEIPTGTIETESPTLRVYPNPVTDRLTIGSNQHTIEYIVISDTSGRIVYQAKPNHTESSIETAAWPAGVYFVLVTTAENRKVWKVVKK